ncbi:unnamed protein product [Closterium sp. Naga37s-1]|nr:unnamed protein product [Closterium sp. Naga37s-1]
MLTSATKVGPEGSLEAHYKLLGNTLGCGRVASVRCALRPRLLRCTPPSFPHHHMHDNSPPPALPFPLASHAAATPHRPCALRHFLCLHKTHLFPLPSPPPPFPPSPPPFAPHPSLATTTTARPSPVCVCMRGSREAVERATGAVVAVKACSKKVLAARPAYISRVSAAPSCPPHHRTHHHRDRSPAAGRPPPPPSFIPLSTCSPPIHAPCTHSFHTVFSLSTHLLLVPSFMPRLPPPSFAALLPRSLPSPKVPPLQVRLLQGEPLIYNLLSPTALSRPLTCLSSPPSHVPIAPHPSPTILPHRQLWAPPAPPIIRLLATHEDSRHLHFLWAAPAPVSPPIIRLLATHEDSRHLHIVTDKAKGGDLFMALAARSSFTEADAAHIARQLLQAVALCHARGVTHRDLVSICLAGRRAGQAGRRGGVAGGRAGAAGAAMPCMMGWGEWALTHSGTSDRSLRCWAGMGRCRDENILLSDAHSLAIKLVDFGSAALFHPAPTTTTTSTATTNSTNNSSTTISSSSSITGETVLGAAEREAEQRAGSPESLVQHGEGVLPGGEGGVVLRDFMGTAFYVAPEVWRHAYGPQADVWSAGAVVAVLLTGPPPSGLTRATVASNATWQAMQKGIVPTLPPETSPAARSFLQALLEPDPCLRPSAAQALLLPWLAGHAAHGTTEVAAGAVARHAAGAVAVTGAAAGKWAPPAVVAPGASAGEEHTDARARGAVAEMQEKWMGKGEEEDGARNARDEERGEREGEVAARRVGQEDEGLLWKGPTQGGAAAEGRVRGGVQLEGSLRGFRMYAATRKLQRACVALLSLELSESEFRQLVRQLASATSAPGTSLEVVSEAGVTVEGQSEHQVKNQQQQQHPPSAMLSLPALLASLDALGHQRLSQQLTGVHSSVMPHSMLAHVPPTVTLQAGAMQSGFGAAGSSAAGREREREERVRGGSGIAAALEKQHQEQQQQQGATNTSLTHPPTVLPPSSSSHAIPPVPLFDLLDFSALVTRHHDMHRLHHHPDDHHPHHPHHPHHATAHAAAAAATRGGAGRGGRREGKGKAKMVSPESGGKSVEAGGSHRGSRRFLGLMRGGEGEKEGESGGSVHGGSLHGSRRFFSAMRAREGEQQEGSSSQHGSRRFFGLLGGGEEDEAGSGARKEGGGGGSEHGSRRFFSMMHGSGAPSPAVAGARSPGGSLRGSFRMARRLGLLRTGGEEGEGEEEDISSPGADGDVVGAMGAMGARSAAPLAMRGPLSPRSPSASTHSDNAGGWARRLNARASVGGAGMTWQSPVGQRKSSLALGISPQSGARQQGRGAVGGGASNGAATLPAASSAGSGHADRGGLPGGVGMLSCQRVQSCVDLAAMGGAAGDESSPAARNGGSRGWGRGKGKGGFWGPTKGGVQGGGGVGGMNGKGTSVHGECLYREFLLSECTP